MKTSRLLSIAGVSLLALALAIVFTTCSKDSSPSNAPPAQMPTINFSDSTVTINGTSGGGAVSRKITGGTPPYILSENPDSTVATAQLRTDTLTLTPVGPGSTSLTITDSSPIPAERIAGTLTVNITVSGGTGGLTAYPTVVYVTVGHTTATRVSGGTPPYSIQTPSAVGVATSALNNDVVTVTGNAQGNTAVTIRDAASTANLVTIPITVNTGGGAIQITVGSGTTPAYSWAGAGLQTLHVLDTSTGTIVWYIVCMEGTDCIPSPVTHGTVPSGAMEFIRVQPVLTPGVEYQVVASRVGGELGDRLFIP